MSITAIGSSFSFIRPEAVGRAASAAPESESPAAPAEASETSEETPARPQASGRSGGSVADELRALMVKKQETDAVPPSPREAARAYGG